MKLPVLIPDAKQDPVLVQSTEFAFDVVSRFLCNNWTEALQSNGQIQGATPHPRPFNVIVIGGGTFGAAIAQHLFAGDKTHSLRIAVLEAGPFALPEHQQNLPMMGNALPAWRRPWFAINNPTKDHPVPLDRNYPGLLFAIGGRSLAWGGWSPELLDAEMPSARWPAAVVTDLKNRYFKEASQQIGVADTNDFINGELQTALRQRFHDGTIAPAANQPVPISNVVQLSTLPDHPGVRYAKTPPAPTDLAEMLGLKGSALPSPATMQNLLKLEAPLAVQTRTESGFFPFNKFSSVPLLLKAARAAATESDGTDPTADARKRLMVIPNCHVQDLVTETQPDNWVRVTGVQVFRNHSPEVINLASGGVVIVALGTVESTRLAQRTFQQSLAGRAYQRMGKNLMAHLRSNINIRVPRTSIPGLSANTNALQAGALFLKGSAAINGTERFFHLQITASGVGAQGLDSESDLYKKVPDLDGLNALLNANETHVVITLRGIGEMEPPGANGTNSFVQIKADGQEFERQQAEVQLTPTDNDKLLWDAMDQCAEDSAIWLANGQAFELLDMPGGSLRKIIPMKAGAKAADIVSALSRQVRRDCLGSTHHECGTLWMGDNAATAVTNDFGRVHDTTNCYVTGPALFPTIGSPNPMLTGIALARRTADMLIDKVLPQPPAFAPIAPAQALFDGTEKSFKQWQRVGGNGFYLQDGQLISYGLADFGLLYFPKPFDEFTLKLQFKIADLASHNSGVFICSRHPMYPIPQFVIDRATADGTLGFLQSNRAWVAVHSGFEVQIDDNAPLRKNRTGALYNIPAGDPGDQASQAYQPGPKLRAGEWFEYEVTVAKAGANVTDITVWLTDLANGQRVQTTKYQNADALRGLLSSTSSNESGFIGLQSYPNNRVTFRHVQIT